MYKFSRLIPGALALGAAAVVCYVAGCSSSKAAGPKAPGTGGGTGGSTGSMTVTVNTPAGFASSVVINGPNSYTTTITATKTLTGLAVGSYTVVADSITGADSVVGTDVDTAVVTGSPATVASGTTTTVTVAYTIKHQVGGLWLTNNDYATMAELSSNQLRHGGIVAPAETLATGINGTSGLALDASGNMWVSGVHSDSLLMYTPAARNAGAGTTSSRVLVSNAVPNAQLAFDRHGNLWAANCALGELHEFTPGQLAMGGPQSPFQTVVLGGCPWALAFDTAGNGWLTYNNRNSVVEFTDTQLQAGGALAPTDSIGPSNGSLDGVTGVAFDAKGNLWVGNLSGSTLVEYTPAQIAAGIAVGDTLTPKAIITLPPIEIASLAFDRSGTLWVSDGNGMVYGLTSSQLGATGTPTPAVAIRPTVPLNGHFAPEQLLFDPYATSTGVSADRVHSSVTPLGRTRALNPNGARRAAR